MPTTVNFVINTSLIFEHDTSCCLPLILKIIFPSLKTFVCLEKRDDDNMTECSFSVWVFYIYYNIFGMENSSCIHIWLPIAIRKENKKDMKLENKKETSFRLWLMFEIYFKFYSKSDAIYRQDRITTNDSVWTKSTLDFKYIFRMGYDEYRSCW